MVSSHKRLLSVAVLLASLLAQSAVAATASKSCCFNKEKEKDLFCKKGTDITQLNLTPVNITVPENYPNLPPFPTINLVAKIASQGTGGKDVLFLHGFPHCHLLWKNQLKPGSKLRTQHNLYTLDFRGQGESDKPAPSAPPQPIPPCPCPPAAEDTVYRPWQNAANDIHETIVQLGLNKPVLVGHSLAAVFINDYLRMYGDSEISGILISGGLPDPVFTLPSLTTWFSPDFLALALSGDLESTDLERFIPATQTFVALAQLGSPCKLAPNDLQEVLMYDTYVPGPIRFSIDCHDGLPPVGSGMPGPNDPIWAAVTVPTMVVHAVEDDIVLFAAGVHLSQVIPNAVLKPFEHAGHLLMLMQSKKFNKVLLHFLDSL